MKPAWIQRPVLLILFSFLLSGCKGDMTDTGNETDIPDKNAVVTESMSEELPVEQTEESTSVLVQDLGELLCERDSVRDLMLVVDRRGLDDITVMTRRKEIRSWTNCMRRTSVDLRAPAPGRRGESWKSIKSRPMKWRFPFPFIRT